MKSISGYIIISSYFLLLFGCKCLSITQFETKQLNQHVYKLPKKIDQKICFINNAVPYEIVVLHKHSSYLEDIDVYWKTVDLRKLISNIDRLCVLSDTLKTVSDKKLKKGWKEMLGPFIVKDYPDMPKRPDYIEYKLTQDINGNKATVILDSASIVFLERYPDGWKIVDEKNFMEIID